MTSVPDPYDFDNEVGWRSYRLLRPCRGMYHDVMRRLPYYGSDITDALTYRTFASTVRIYFVKSGYPILAAPMLLSIGLSRSCGIDQHAVSCLL